MSAERTGKSRSEGLLNAAAAKITSSATTMRHFEKDPQFAKAISTAPHLMNYILQLVQDGSPIPQYYSKIDSSLKNLRQLNLIYPISDRVFIHINGWSTINDGYVDYVIIEPSAPHPSLMATVDRIFAIEAGSIKTPVEYGKRSSVVEEFLNDACIISKNQVNYDNLKVSVRKSKTKGTSVAIEVYDKDFENLKYHFIRRRAGSGILEPFLADPNLEDISVAGAGNVYIVHKVFGPLRVKVTLTSEEIDELIIGLSEQFGKTVSHARPVIDSSLQDGSRINVIFGKDVSRKGTNATIRKFAKVPLSITQLMAANTLDAREAAYLWMMLSEGMSVFICGETASGKTTTMTAISAFIPSTWKIVSIEDTQEITLPHPNWVNEITRDTGSAHSSVTMFDLLKAALRQRPNYILVGEIRGAEGNIAFQAMQTGHPVISTFHAASVQSLIQRLTGNPIEVPKTHIDNLNIALFQSAVQGKDGKTVRRVITINEIVGYNPASDNVLFIPVFNWDSGTDAVVYRGKGSSSLFLSKLLMRRGLSRKDEGILYNELDTRTKILHTLMEKKVFNYFDVYNHLIKAKEIGIEPYLKELTVS